MSDESGGRWRSRFELAPGGIINLLIELDNGTLMTLGMTPETARAMNRTLCQAITSNSRPKFPRAN